METWRGITATCKYRKANKYYPVSSDIASNRFGADSINFKPSPNFKNMKKFFKSKLGIEVNKLKNGNTLKTELLSPIKIDKCDPKIAIQPPLSLEPPSNDNIESTKNILKAPVNHGNFKEDSEGDLKGKPRGKPKETVCRDFLRGTCTRVGCRFAHKSDVSHEDLYGIYIFCHEYQSQSCTRAYCRYVHATVFEEQEYYRTRYLPPHAFAHRMHNNNNNKSLLMPPPPPPPPPPPVTQGPPTSNKETINFKVPPPPLHNESLAAANCVTSNAINVTQPSTIAPRASLAPLVQSSTKRNWSLMETLSNPGGCGIDDNMQAPKKCKQCNNNKFRYQYNKDKFDKLKLAKKEIHKNIAILDKNSKKLNTFIQAFLIRSISKSPNLHC